MSSNIINLLCESFLETILMVGVSGGLGAAIGIPLGVFLFVTSPKGIMPKPYVNRIIGTVVNAVRSTPFIILLVAIIPFTRLIVGSSIEIELQHHPVRNLSEESLVWSKPVCVKSTRA